MKTRVSFFYVLSIFCGLAMFGCNDDDAADAAAPAIQTPTIQTHDENEMMALLHEMTDAIDTITLLTNHGDDFAHFMQVHHQYAMKMGKLVLDKGDDATMLSLAQDVIKHKESQLPGLQAYLEFHTTSVDAKGVIFDAEAKAALDTMHVRADKETLTGDADKDFAVIFKHHNQSTIVMAESYFRLGRNPNLKALTQQMIVNATNTNKAIEDWLTLQPAEGQ
jgi:uncharacterized protein (DUF305 family)